VWTAWLRLPLCDAIRATIVAAARAGRDVSAWKGVVVAMSTLPAVWPERNVVPPFVAQRWRMLSS
jgi:hypothetical protein